MQLVLEQFGDHEGASNQQEHDLHTKIDHHKDDHREHQTGMAIVCATPPGIAEAIAISPEDKQKRDATQKGCNTPGGPVIAKSAISVECFQQVVGVYVN